MKILSSMDASPPEPVVSPSTRTPARTAAAVEADTSGMAWMLSTPGTSYVVAVSSAAGAVVQRYWGRRLDADCLPYFVEGHRDRWVSTFERPAEADEELPVDGGPRWGPPALQVRFHDGTRSLNPVFVRARIDADAQSDTHTLVLELRDETRPLRFELHYRVHGDDDGVERWATVYNDDPDHDAALLRFDSGSWLVPDLTDYRLSATHGYWGAETQPERRFLPIGEHRIGSRQGVTGHAATPWLAIDDGTATEEHGAVWSVALAWSGSWHLTARRRPEGSLSLSGGWSQDGIEQRLAPGGSLSTPVMTGVFRADGFTGTSHAWHDLVRRRVLPHGGEVRPVLYNSWEATGFAVDAASQAELAALAASIGVELFVVDDGWFAGRAGDSSGLGDWWPDPEKFPHGLRPLVDAVHGLGMLFGIWVEPEMANVASGLFTEHPDWVMRWPDRTPTEIRNQRVLDFGLPEVRAHTFHRLDRLVAEHGVDFMKWDMNRPFTDAGSARPDRRDDDIWRSHVEGVYEVVDRLRAAHPSLRIESCASGGARLDLGILHRTDQVWPSDNTDALDRQRVQDGYGYAYPAGTMSSWVTDAVNPMTGRTVPLDYRFHVSMAGVLGIGADIRTWSEKELARAADHVRAYKEIRSTVQLGRQYRLGGVPGRELSAVQYVDDRRVVVLAYEPQRSLSAAPRRIRLRGLEPDALYREQDTGRTLSGAYLMGQGIKANGDLNDRGWDNLRFSNRDYASTLTVLERLG